MAMIWGIARRELALQLRDGRLILTGAALLLAVLAATASGWFQYQRAEAEREHFVAQAREQWLNQGARHPHRAAHFGAYVVMPELSLAMFEPGLRPFAGQTLWLEAHDRPAFANVPSEDDLTLGTGLGVASGAAILQMLGGLFALTLGALAIVRDREGGVLRLALSQGVDPRVWAAGKFLGVAAAIALPLAPAAILALGAATLSAPAGAWVDILVRGLVMLATDAALLMALLAVGLTISAVARTSRGALILALSIWVAAFVLTPRAVASMIERAAPAPTLADYQKAAGEDFSSGFDGKPGYDAQLTALEQTTMQRYGVSSLDALPTGFSGIRMRHLDSWNTAVDDRQYARLVEVYDTQSALRLGASVVSPFVAARSVSQGMAGMDWAHHRDFLEAAERYRRGFGLQMNLLLEHGVSGDRWEMDGGRRDWEAVKPFHYESPTSSWAVARQGGFIGVLAAWLAAALAALWIASGRMRP